MTKHKFTKGDWLLSVDKIEIACADYPIANVTCGDWGDYYPSIKLTGPSMDIKAEAFMDGMPYGNVPREEAEANARLIRAAPKLLDALEAALGKLHHLQGVGLNFISYDSAVEKAGVAIALALEEEEKKYEGFNSATLEARIIRSDDARKTVTVSGMDFYITRDGFISDRVDVVYYDDTVYASKTAFVGQYIIADGNKWEIIPSFRQRSVSA